MASVMQGVSTNFEIDIFKPIIQNISEITEVKYDNRTENGKLMNRIADHIRAIIFCISDGVLPGNEGRGYVERRLLRRAVRDGLKLGKEDCFLYKLVPIIADVMHEAYPEIKQRREKRQQHHLGGHHRVVIGAQQTFQTSQNEHVSRPTNGYLAAKGEVLANEHIVGDHVVVEGVR